MNRKLTIFFKMEMSRVFQVMHIYNSDQWQEYSEIHFKTKDGKSYSVRTADIERVEIEEE